MGMSNVANKFQFHSGSIKSENEKDQARHLGWVSIP